MANFLLPLLSKVKTGLLGLIKKPIVWVCLALAIAIAVVCIQAGVLNKQKSELLRLRTNQEALLSEVEYHSDRNGQLVASINALTLRKDELENLIPSYTQEIRDLKLKLKNVKTVAHVAVETKADIQAPVSIVAPPEHQDIQSDAPKPAPEKPHEFYWQDDWITVSGIIYADSLAALHVEHRDSLTLIAHKTKRRCCRKSKIIKYDVQSKSPYTTVKDLSYVELTE